MSKKQWLIMVGVIGTVANCVYAGDITETFRTLAAGTGVYQKENTNSKPIYGFKVIYGHDLVSAALGVPLSTTLTDQVLALQIDCESTHASLVVFDKVSSNNIATIATSTSLDVVLQQDVNTNAFPNRERFVAQFAITPTNHLLGGFLTMAGRLQLNPTNGCPRAIKVEVDPFDHFFADSDQTSAPDDPLDRDILRAGIAHAVGEVDVVFDNSTTNKVLLPFEAFSIRRPLP